MRRNPPPSPADAATVEELLQALLDAIAAREHLANNETIIVGGVPFTKSDLNRLARTSPDELRRIGCEVLQIRRTL